MHQNMKKTEVIRKNTDDRSIATRSVLAGSGEALWMYRKKLKLWDAR